MSAKSNFLARSLRPDANIWNLARSLEEASDSFLILFDINRFAAPPSFEVERVDVKG